MRNLLAGCLLAGSLAVGLPAEGATDIEVSNGSTKEIFDNTTVDGSFKNEGTLTTQANIYLQNATSIVTTGTSTLNIQGTADGSQRKIYIADRNQLDALLGGKLIIGPGANNDIGRGQLEIESMDTLTLSNNDFASTGTVTKITIQEKGGLNHHGAVELTGNSFNFGGHAANSAGDAGYAPRIKAGSFFLNPTGNEFTLSAGRLYARGYAWENSVVRVGDGTGKLILDGGSLRLGDADQSVVGGRVEASVTVTSKGEFRVSSGNWDMTGTLDVQSGGSFVLGKDADDDGNALSASLNIENAKLEANSKLNVIDGNVTKFNNFIGDATAAVNVGDSTSSGTFIADNLQMNGGRIDFDPPVVAAGDMSNVSLGALNFTSSNVDARLNVGQNSMVSLGSTDAEWLRTEVNRYQNDGKGTWGQDVTAALAVRTPQTLDATKGGITVDGSWTHGGAAATANAATFADKSLFVVDAAGVDNAVALSGEAGGTSTLTVDAGAKLHIVGGRGGQTVNITDRFGPSTKDAASWTDANLTTSTALLSATGGTFDPATGTYSVNLTSNAAAEVFPKLSNEMAALVDQMALRPGVDVDSSQAGVRFLSRALSDNYIGTTNKNLAASTIESAARMAVIGGVPQMTWAANNAAGNAVTQRTSLARPAGGIQAVASDGSAQPAASGKDIAKTGFAMWVMPLYQSWNGFGLEGGNFDLDVNGGLGGVAIGADYTFAEAIRAGITFNIGGGYAEGSGDFSKTTNNMNFWGIGAYLGWTPGNFGLTADVNYTSTYNKVEQELPAEMQMGDLKSDITAYALSTGLRGEYRLETSVLDIVPHVGVRYTALNTNDYDVKSNGTVLKGDGINQNIWTFPVGVAFSKELETGNGWHFKPGIDLAVIPAAGDIKAKGDVRFTGVPASAEVETQTMDYITYMGQVGLEFGNNSVSLGVNYNLQAGANTTAHGVFGTFRYEF